jgi:DNA-binding Lrp family transcriptional regulator
MTKPPSKIGRTFERLRQELRRGKGRITLKKIKGNYYVYRESSVWDRERKRPNTISEYLGRIMPDGTYAKKLASYADELEKAKAVIAEKGGEIIWHATEDKRMSAGSDGIDTDEVDRRLLTALSMNARASFASIGKLIGLSATATYNRIKNLEKRYGIRYVAEIDIDKLGFLTYLTMIKFQGEVPTIEQLKKVIGQDPRAQLAFLTKGEHDILLFSLTEAAAAGRFNLYKERESIFPNLNARWYRAPIYIIYDFIPLREEFFEILKERVWQRSKEVPRPPEDSLSTSEYSVLYELNKNGMMDFSEIDKKYGFDKGRAQYAYQRLRKKGIIKRITMSLTNLPVRSLAVLYVENINDRGWEETKPHLNSHILKETNGPINRYALEGDTGIPNGTIFLLPVFRDTDLEEAERELSIVKNAKVTTLLIASTIVGTPCFRKFDNTHTAHYAKLAKLGVVPEKTRINYD